METICPLRAIQGALISSTHKKGEIVEVFNNWHRTNLGLPSQGDPSWGTHQSLEPEHPPGIGGSADNPHFSLNPSTLEEAQAGGALQLWDYPVLHNGDCTVRPCLKKNKKQWIKNKPVLKKYHLSCSFYTFLIKTILVKNKKIITSIVLFIILSLE